MFKKLFFLPLLLLPFLFPQPAYAHAFGKLYNLPIPFWMYLYGGASALIISFVVIGYFVTKSSSEITYLRHDITRSPLIAFLTRPSVVRILQGLSVFFFVLALVSGWVGINEAYNNFNMTFFWIIFLLGFTYLTAIVGDVFTVLNPWKMLANRYDKGRIRYPKALGYYPAFLTYAMIIWFELVGQTTPWTLSLLLLLYTCLSMIGVWLFGKENWFRYGDFFSVFFRLIGKLSVIEYDKGKFFVRPPFVGLIKEKADHVSLLLFILFMLSSTAFDGFRETLPWVRMSGMVSDPSYPVFQTVGLLLSPVVFLFLYCLLIGAAKLLVRSKQSLRELFVQFALPLVPIAFVYNIAHYYTLLLSEGLNIMRLLSDPFGWGWNLFGTADYYQSIIPDANFVWHSQVGFILLGHIVGVYLAHVVALKIFPSHKKALISQLPMLVLMVIYTMIGLWILSQPIAPGV